MIQSLSDLNSYVRADAAGRKVKLSFIVFLTDPILRFTVYLRVNEYLKNANIPFALRLIPLFVFERLSIRLGFSIPLNVFGPGVAIVHYGTIVIHPDCRIGENARIHVGVNIGSDGLMLRDGVMQETVPSIGNNCYVGPGAKLFGDIVHGDHCIIGANAVVNRSFPERYLTVAGVPAKIIKRRAPDEDRSRHAD